jgi:transcriptional regulator GlxA family with amidase domain
MPSAKTEQNPAAGKAPVFDAPLTFALLIFAGFPMMAFSSVIEPLRAANVLARRECYRWIIVGAAGKTIEASNGVVIKPEF